MQRRWSVACRTNGGYANGGETGADHAVFPLPARDSPRHPHHQQRGIAEPVTAQDHYNPGGGFPNEEAALKLLFLALRQAAKKCGGCRVITGGSLEPLHDSVAGTDASPGAGGVMNRKPFLKSLSEGRGCGPLPSRTHPQKQTPVVYTEELTHLKQTLVVYAEQLTHLSIFAQPIDLLNNSPREL